MTREQSAMIVVVLITNLICTGLVIGKAKDIKKNTLYDAMYQIVYPLLGTGIGTVLAYLIKYF